MANTVESVKQYGVLVPAIARPLEEGGYELVADIGGITPANWLGLPKCLLSSVIWMMMKQPSLWWIATCNGKACCRVSVPLLFKMKLDAYP
jgi:hypothetical protein